MFDHRQIVVFLVKAVILTSAVISAQECITPRNTTGQCVSLNQCPIIINIIKSNRLNSELKSYLQEYNCGYDGNYPRVCCENDAGPCQTYDRSPGVCVFISRCNPFLSLLEKKPLLSDTTVEFLRLNECEYGREARVCCPLITKKKEAFKKKEKLPQPGECGTQEIQDKLLGGVYTDISEFPWMALLEYGTYENPTLACGATLISERFVLTAAHCVVGPEVIRYGNLQRVRLGEYDIKNITDCVTKVDYNDCSDPLQRIDVENIISHEEFNLRNRNKEHDIALIKMKKTVKYTEFIRPICLPPPFLDLPNTFVVSGWGKTETAFQSNIKLKLQLPQFDQMSCRSLYAGLRFPVKLGQGQICAGGVAMKDSCTGDSGGPLMVSIQDAKNGNVWFQAGVVSFGPVPCGQAQPGVYTKVQEYLPWIHKTVTSTEI